MSSAIGPFAVDEGLVPRPRDGEAVVRIHNTNTKKIIVSRFGMDGEEAAVAGDMTLDGVAGTGAPIRLEFMEPGGAKTGKLLPTGKPADMLEVEGLGRVAVSMIDAANPCVFVPAEAVGATATERPTEIEGNAPLMAKLEAVRRAASVAMGIAARPREGRQPQRAAHRVRGAPRGHERAVGPQARAQRYGQSPCA